MKRLSIIVPMYRVGPYIEKCLRSLENQDIAKDDYEIICINDGSPDKCKEIVKDLQREFTNIILLDQENQGVSIARNKGIDKASGTYILFIDPDDFVETNIFNEILKKAESANADISFQSFNILDKNGKLTGKVNYEQFGNKIFQGTKAYFIARGDGYSDPDRMVAILFKRQFFDKYQLRYLPEVPFLEDGEFIARILCLADRCIFDSHSLYWRTTRPGSAVNSKLFYTSAATNGFVRSAMNLRSFRASSLLSQEQKLFMNQPVVKFVILAVASTCSLSRRKDLRKLKFILCKNDLKKLDIQACQAPYKKLGFIYNRSVYLLYLCLIIQNIFTVIGQRISKPRLK